MQKEKKDSKATNGREQTESLVVSFEEYMIAWWKNGRNYLSLWTKKQSMFCATGLVAMTTLEGLYYGRSLGSSKCEGKLYY